MTITVLSIRQPWAQLIIDGVKRVENRSWRVPYRGTLYIHASSKKLTEGEASKIVHLYYDTLSKKLMTEKAEFQYGCIIGKVDLVDILPDLDDPFYNPGSWAWILRNAKKLKNPIITPGRLGLWTMEIDKEPQ